jgi:glycine cleavage system regulatory protein
MAFDSDYSPRTLRHTLQRGEHVMDARLMPHAQHVAVVILVDGRARAANAFEHQTDAVRWAEEQQVINARDSR